MEGNEEADPPSDMPESMIMIDEGADQSDFTLLVGNHKLMVVYGDTVHHNDGTHLGGGIQDGVPLYSFQNLRTTGRDSGTQSKSLFSVVALVDDTMMEGKVHKVRVYILKRDEEPQSRQYYQIMLEGKLWVVVQKTSARGGNCGALFPGKRS
eukprot:9397228-Ditylum_brightwellii.AAC.1